MGFYEDDRIRRKNSSYTDDRIDNKADLTLHGVSLSEIISVLASNGLKVKLEQNGTISISKGTQHGEKVEHDNWTLGST